MKKQIIEIDINKLSNEKLEMLQKIIAEEGQADWASKSDQVYQRIAFQAGWMDAEHEKQYCETYCY